MFRIASLPTAIVASLLTTSPLGGEHPRTGIVASPLPPWGAFGHALATRAAMAHLPEEMPIFFREAGAQLEYLGAEPDRWRSGTLKAMDDAWEFDHYIDLENVPPGALDASDRYEFLAVLHRAGIHRPQQFVGFLPWRILELHQRLTKEFALWRNTAPGPERGFVEARIIQDAGILGHYAADAAQPHHTTIHFNGWAEGAPNPEGYTTSRDFHSRFESAFVQAHLTLADVLSRVPSPFRELESPRSAVWELVRESNGAVRPLYELEKERGFDPEGPVHPETVAFAAERLARGAEMLRDLWWTAWVESEGLAEELKRERW